MAGIFHLPISISASQFVGRTRGRLSIKPPPVMWARPFRLPGGTLARCGW